MKNESETALTVRPESSVAISDLETNPIQVLGGMLQTFMDKGVSSDNVLALEKTLALFERMEQRASEKQFASALSALQSDLPEIVASTEIPNRGRYERFEDVMHVLKPLLAKHGFSVTFTNKNEDNRITETCTLKHKSGFERANSFTVRVGGRADSETQADCKAATVAKRNCLLNALNIVIRQDCLQDEDDNPMNEGAFITPQQAEELQRRVQETESNEIAFLKLAGIGAVVGNPNLSHYKSIMSGKYSMLDELLAKKESRGR